MWSSGLRPGDDVSQGVALSLEDIPDDRLPVVFFHVDKLVSATNTAIASAQT